MEQNRTRKRIQPHVTNDTGDSRLGFLMSRNLLLLNVLPRYFLCPLTTKESAQRLFTGRKKIEKKEGWNMPLLRSPRSNLTLRHPYLVVMFTHPDHPLGRNTDHDACLRAVVIRVELEKKGERKEGKQRQQNRRFQGQGTKFGRITSSRHVIRNPTRCGQLPMRCTQESELWKKPRQLQFAGQ